MPKKLTLTSTWAAGIEESTYLACVFAFRSPWHTGPGDPGGSQAGPGTCAPLTSAAKEHIIDIRTRCGPGKPSGGRRRSASLRAVRGRP